MSVFRIFVDGQLFFHPQLSQLAITEAKLTEDAENIDRQGRKCLYCRALQQ